MNREPITLRNLLKISDKMSDDFEFGSDICMMMSDDLQFSGIRSFRPQVESPPVVSPPSRFAPSRFAPKSLHVNLYL
jgi:hypothetical protein